MTGSKRLVGLLLIGVLGLAACGGEDQPTTATPYVPGLPETAAVEEPLATEPPTDLPAPSPTAPLEAGGALFEQAAASARADLSTRLSVSQNDLTLLDPAAALALSQPLACPTVEGDGITLYYVYVQHERFIYPYQFYAPPGAEDRPVVEACEDRLVDQDVLYVPTPDARPQVMDRVKNDLRARGIDPDAGDYRVSEMVWSDDALGCAVPPGDPTPQPASIPGYLIRYTLEDQSYEYHTDEDGGTVNYCAPPKGYASSEAFLFTLRKDDTLVVETPGETVRYAGLDRDGQLVLLGPEQWRLGVFNYDSPEAARAAAQQVTDPAASVIFVGGYVLIVEEEFSPQVYSLLLQYAEPVRNLIEERQSAPASGATEAAP